VTTKSSTAGLRLFRTSVLTSRSWLSRKSDHSQLYLLLPTVLYFLVFKYGPMYGIQIAFKDFNPVQGIWGSPWVGFEHFTRFFNSYQFGTLLRNTLWLSVYALIVSFPLPVFLSLIMNQYPVALPPVGANRHLCTHIHLDCCTGRND
jgi:ABC-type polysaccharide transport system permease subunit